MDNLELARMYGADEFDIFSQHDDICDDFNYLAIADALRYNCVSNINQTRDIRHHSKQVESRQPIKLTYIPDRTTGVDGYPYVKVDFSWKSGSKELDPNDMDTKHIENSITYIKRLVDEGKKSELEGDRVIRGFNKILTARKNADPIEENISDTFKIIKDMETPVISVFDKSTGEVVDLYNIPDAIILGLVKKYCS